MAQSKSIRSPQQRGPSDLSKIVLEGSSLRVTLTREEAHKHGFLLTQYQLVRKTSLPDGGMEWEISSFTPTMSSERSPVAVLIPPAPIYLASFGSQDRSTPRPDDELVSKALDIMSTLRGGPTTQHSDSDHGIDEPPVDPTT